MSSRSSSRCHKLVWESNWRLCSKLAFGGSEETERPNGLAWFAFLVQMFKICFKIVLYIHRLRVSLDFYLSKCDKIDFHSAKNNSFLYFIENVFEGSQNLTMLLQWLCWLYYFSIIGTIASNNRQKGQKHVGWCCEVLRLQFCTSNFKLFY